MPKKCCLGEPFEKQHGKRTQALLKSAPQHIYRIHWSLPSRRSWKKSLLLTWKILVLLFNTMAADELYPVLNRKNLTIPIKKQLSLKRNTFCEFWAAFLKSWLSFKYFGKRDDPCRFCISEITDSENGVR